MATAILLLPKQYHQQPLPKMTAIQNWDGNHIPTISEQVGGNSWLID
jgi:hypothetical protein